MSDSEQNTPEKAPKPTAVAGTPGDRRFPASTLKVIAAMIVQPASLAVEKTVADIFAKRGIEDWSSLELEDLDEVKTMIEENEEWMRVLKDKRIIKLLTVIEYAVLGGSVVDETSTFTDLFKRLREMRASSKLNMNSGGMADMSRTAGRGNGDFGTSNAGLLFTPALNRDNYTPAASMGDTNTEAAVSSSGTEKFGDVPKLPVFSGEDHDYEKWKRAVMVALGSTKGLLPFIQDPEKVTQYPEIAENVFFGLSRATMNGLAASFVNELELVNADHDPYKLWNALRDYYETETSIHTITMNQIRRLINLKLDEGIPASKFLADWKDCVLRLQEVKATFVEDQKWLLALLYSAILDENYNSVLDKISANNTITVKEVLRDIRTRAEQLNRREGNKLSGDGMAPTKTARRVGSTTAITKSSKNQEAGKGYKIPFFPKSWMRGIAYPIYKVMKKWRYEVNQGNNDWETLDEMCALPSLDNNETGHKHHNAGNKHGKHTSSSKTKFSHKKSRRTRSADNNNADTGVSDAASSSESSSNSKKNPRPPTNKRIRLNYKSKQSKPKVGFVDPNA